jgi:hypothetical protein
MSILCFVPTAIDPFCAQAQVVDTCQTAVALMTTATTFMNASSSLVVAFDDQQSSGA